MSRWVWLVAVMSLSAAAQDERELFEQGSALFAKGAWRDAARKFEASYAVRPLPITKFNSARCYEAAGDALLAIDAYQTYLLLTPNAADHAEVFAAVRKQGQKLAKLGVQALTITSLPLGAFVFVDGQVRGSAPLTLELTAGRHLIRLELSQRVPVERTIVTSLDAPTVESFDLPPAPVAEIITAPPMPVARQSFTTLEVPTPGRGGSFDAMSPGPDAVMVHVQTDNPETRLYRLGHTTDECRAPCDVLVPRATDRFVVGGSGITPSSEFVLIDHRSGGKVSLKVKAGNSVAGLLGAVGFGTLGVGTGSLGLAFLIVPQSDPNIRWLAPAGLVTGILSGLAAIAMAVFNGTTVTFDP